MKPRSVRNNNPGNVIRAGIQWDGMAVEQQDPRFVTFADPKYGFRAMARILMQYRKHGWTTVRQVISHWAPPSENDTASYVDSVSAQLGVRPDEQLQLSPESPQLRDLIRAIATHETGYFAWSAQQLDDGVAMA